MNITKGKIAKAQKVILYGPEGVGKSTFASQFPDPIFIDTEGGTSNMDVARFDKPTSFQFLNQQVDYVLQNKPCKTLVIDTIDWAERMIIENLCQSEKKSSIEDFGYGSGYIKLEEHVGRFLNKLQEVVDIGINVVLTAHAQIKKFEQPDEMGAYDRWELKLGKKTTAKTSALVKEWADMVLFINYKTYSVSTDDKGKKFKAQGGQRTVFATHHPAWDAKNRHGLPDEFSLDYSNIAHIFVDTPVTQSAPVANPELVQEPTKPAEPIQNTEPVQEPQQEAVQVNSSLPQALQDLMIQNNVSEEEIDIVVSQKGYFPQGTPIMNYGDDFINGVLIAAWDQVFAMIKDFRNKVPFN